MHRPVLQDLSPIAKLLFAALLSIVGLVLLTLLGMLVVKLLPGPGLQDILNAKPPYDAPGIIVGLKILQAVQSLGVFLLPPLFLAWFYDSAPLRYLGLDRKPGLLTALLSVSLVFISLPFINWLVALNGQLQLPSLFKDLEAWMKTSEQQAGDLTAAFMKGSSIGILLANLLVMAVIPAIGEELFFRGILQKILQSWMKSINMAVVLASIIFSIFHFQFYGFLPRTILGLMLGYLYAWTGSLWVPMLFHFIFNAGSVVVAYMENSGFQHINYDSIGSSDKWYIILLSLLCTFSMALVIRFLADRKRPMTTQSF